MFERLTRIWTRRSPSSAASTTVAPSPVTAEWCSRRRERSLFHTTIDRDALAALTARDPERTQATQKAADRLLRHEFDLLGSGPFVPHDPDRPPRHGYSPIDWYLDPVRSLRFPRGVPHKAWHLMEMRPGNADVKYPWELARCQHWATLAQAFRLTGDDRYAVEIAHELDDFVEANPTGIGVNWTCTMDVGLRVVSWSTALEAVHACTALSDDFWLRAYNAMYDHGVFIRGNLENTYEVTSNHYLSNLLGLLFLGRTFDGLASGAEWAAFSRDAIEQEMRVQVLADGADYESSIPYHRLVTELFLGALRLSDHAGTPMSDASRSRVQDMVAFLAGVLRPDGLMPQVGDADDGRLHIFEGYAATTPQDPRHLFGPSAAMFGEAAWAALGGAGGAWEAAWWGLGSRASMDGAAREVSRLFPNAGIAVASTATGHYLLATNAVVGTNGFGNHKHNDLLSFEYHHEGVPWIVDPGSYVYTSDSEARNRFRSTAAHNTMMIDSIEQNEFRSDWLFRMFETAKPETISFADRDGIVEYVGRHHGYERLPEPLTHTRAYRFARSSGDLDIVDRLEGTGSHQLRWHFHFAPGVEARQTASGEIELTRGARRRRLRLPERLAVAVVAADYSPSYGVKQPCVAVDATAAVAFDGGAREWAFRVTS